MTFGAGQPPITTVDEQLAKRMVDRALDAGVNLIDTADVYAAGGSEEILGAAIRDRRDDVLVATKVGFGRAVPAHSYDNVINGRGSLRRLGTDHIDLYQLHRPDRTTPIEETWPHSRTSCRSRGLVRDRRQQSLQRGSGLQSPVNARRDGTPSAAVQIY